MLQRYGYIGVNVGTVEAYTAASISHSACRAEGSRSRTNSISHSNFLLLQGWRST